MPSSRVALSFIFMAIFIDVIGLGIIIPVLPALLKEMSGGDLSTASLYGGWLMFSYAAFEFLFAPLIGGLSDQYGRKRVLVLSLFGFTLDYLFLAFAPNIFWFFVGRIIAGILGASYSTGTAYIADISTAENKAKNFGLVGVAFGLGFIIGPF
jgi:DHA1 family tetracycline resistance protein-like MFS transporter